MQTVEDLTVVPKTEHSRDGSLSSLESSPEPEIDEQTPVNENVQVQKRKGGRKPIYATSEERKQRNRQAQAAFRERRTEYIKQLENTIKHQDETLQNLQQSHRSAADECLMLRYKNSLLERILLEKGIDVQAELKTKEEATPSTMPLSMSQPTPAQRAVMNRHHQLQRANSSTGPRLIQAQKSRSNTVSSQSPQLQPTPPSQTSSPTASRSPNYGLQGGMTSPHAALQAQQQFKQQQQQLQPPLRPPQNFPQHSQSYPSITIPASNTKMQNMHPNGPLGPGDDGRNSAGGIRPNHWSSPYQTHMEQLGKLTRPFLSIDLLPVEQEYNTQLNMPDDQDASDHSAGPGPYPQPPDQRPYAHSMIPPPNMQQTGETSAPEYAMANQMFDPFDPMLDADPFGLTASMHFPTQFTFQESAMRK